MSTASIRARSPRIVQSRQNARVRELRAGFARASRTEHGHIAIEGEHLLLEAVAARLNISAVFIREGSESLSARSSILDGLHLPVATEILTLPLDVFTSAVRTESPQGIAALVDPPAFTLDQIFNSSATPLILIAAGIQDPGNLGTLIRSAEAFGATGFIILPGTVSPWNQKALRASAGSVFRLPLVAAREDEVFPALASRNIATLAAVATDGSSLDAHDLTRPTALILGNEGSGIPSEVLRAATARVTIPTPGPVESLNAAIAGSILLYESSRQRATPGAPPFAPVVGAKGGKGKS
jgi:TrmH family RNA methyltransferase